MDMVLADLELDLREIRYLTRDLSNQPDEALVEITKRRINQMQVHLEGLLRQMNELNGKPSSTPKEDVYIKPAVNLKDVFTLNDTFRFSRELFGGDIGYMNQTLEQMTQMQDWDLMPDFLQSKTKQQENPGENEVFDEFLELIKNSFT